MVALPNIGDTVRSTWQPFLVGRVLQVKMGAVEVRLDTGSLTFWSHGNYEPVDAQYYTDGDNKLYRLDIDPSNLQRVGLWVKVNGHWERAPREIRPLIPALFERVEAPTP